MALGDDVLGTAPLGSETVRMVERTRGADRYVVLTYFTKQVVAELTAQEYADLALPGADAPPRVSQQDWWSNALFAAGGVPDYGNGLLGVLAHGEYAELADRFEIGVKTETGRVSKIQIMKSDVVVDKTAGLTLLKSNENAWPECIVSINAGVLVT